MQLLHKDATILSLKKRLEEGGDGAGGSWDGGQGGGGLRF